MNRKEFFRKVEGVVAPREINRVSLAYWLAKETHRSAKRDGGERYFEHCRRTACILIGLGGATADEIVIALLHDSVEDGFIPFDVMRTIFGSYVTVAVHALSKMVVIFDEDTGFVREKKKKEPAKYFRMIREADRAIRRVKLADRLDNIGDMAAWPEARKLRYIRETKKYILPIARMIDHRLAEALEKYCRQ